MKINVPEDLDERCVTLAELVLEKVMLRKRWQFTTRDDLARYIERFIFTVEDDTWKRSGPRAGEVKK